MSSTRRSKIHRLPEQKAPDDPELAQHIGRACREAREELTLSQAEVALMVAIDSEYYGRLERAEAIPSLSKLNALAMFLGLSVDYMLGRSKTADIGLSKPIIQDSPAMRRVMRLVRQAKPETQRIILAVLEKIHGQSSSTEEDA